MRRSHALLALALAPALARAEPGPWTARLDLAHTAFSVPAGTADAVVHVPEGLDPTAPLHVVVLLHGWSCCAESFVGTTPCGPRDPATRGWNVARHHDRARTSSILVAPQLALLARDSSPGRFGERGFFRDWLAEVLAGPLAERVGRTVRPADVASVTLVAHSAGYQTALAIVDRGEVPVTNVVLLDALYSGTERFLAWVAEADGRRLVSVHTALRSTSRQSALLARLARGRLGRRTVATVNIAALGRAIARHRVVTAETPFGHGEVPARHLAEILGSLGLPPRGR
jgi:pimeloyl-ACP methyl ester carboxylesterase